MTIHSFDTSPIKRISAQALTSNAVNHPYLSAIQNGDFPNMELVIKDFAFEYAIYSSQFTRYLSAVIDHLRNPKHQQILLENLTEEQGDTHDVELPPDVLASIDGIPHSQLFQRFQTAVGIDEDYRNTHIQSQTSTLWRDQFLQLCQIDECVGIGAIGIGTEFIVSSIYQQILKGLEKHTELTMSDHVFFDLHSQCDDEHAAQMLSIAKDLSHDDTNAERIEYGAKMAINMRVAFWDVMLARAQKISTSNPLTAKQLSNA